ncbi:hypothetical protein BXZ70DRAFT_902711 [Cristinia sonorae]|uniref:Alcohol dehydrogenase-like N-terminal domain-containing protein n=1 Tax=Cristinia sonorae TaxID=1940300 RepID=A0A8K0XJL3_9AGAR|nr:hypothetical protein BXZ70DRAFT_902711 [Cristinia sonorae]
MLVDPKALISALLPTSSQRTLSGPKRSFTQDSSESSLSSTSSSTNSSDTESASSSRATTSSRITTPINSDGSSRRRVGPEGGTEVEAITISTSKTSKPLELGPTNAVAIRTRSRASASTITENRSRTQNEMRRLTYTDEDWAKDVRWLSPEQASTSSPRRTQSVGSASSSSSSRNYPRPSPSTSKGPYPPQSKAGERRHRSRRSRGSRGSRGRMSALMEEDESDYTDVTPGASSTEPSRAPSPVLESPRRSEDTTPKAASPLRASVDDRMEDEDLELLESPDARVQAYARSHRRSYSHTRPLSRSLTLSRPVPSSSASDYASALPTHSLPTPYVSSSSASNGYTGLTMAHAGYVGRGKSSGNGKIDLVKAGIAQSTMATVEVVQGSSQLPSAFLSPSKKKRRTLSISLKFLSRGSGRRKEGATPSHLLQDLPLPVAFTAHLPSPSSVPSSHVLIQVFAVGLDGVDSSLVREKVGADRVKGGGQGFIPGRSVVGRVVECGWEVKADVCKKGDWVIGLLELKKCGALAEFVVLERHRLHRAPQPRSRPTTLFPSAVNRRSHVRSMSLPSHLHELPSINGISVGTFNQLSIEELALLPLNALPAHRAVRTLADAIASPTLPRRPEGDAGPTALVLHGHDGPGSMVVQMLIKRGVRVWAQVPQSAVPVSRDGPSENTNGTETNGRAVEPPLKRSGSTKQPSHPKSTAVEARLRAWGAQHVCIGDAFEVIARLATEGQCFDAVVDTVGGANIWTESQKLLLGIPSHGNVKDISTHAQFTTLIGDNPDKPIPTAQDNLRTGFRSFGRTLTVPLPEDPNVQMSPSKGSAISLPLSRKHSRQQSISRSRTTTVKRTVGYAWVSVAADVDYEGEDVRDALGSVVGMVEEGWIRPWIGDEGNLEERRVVPFERSPEIFTRDNAGPVGLLRDGGTCVVRIVS